MGADICLSMILHPLGGGRVEGAGRLHSGGTHVTMSDNPPRTGAGDKADQQHSTLHIL